jgi:hypothetical protein
MNERFYMILIFGKNISQYMQGSALHKHRTFYIAISPCMYTLYHREILLTCFVKLATGQDARLVRLPPSEATLRRHILRASFQTKVWHSCLAKPPLPSTMEYGWRTVKDSLHPVYAPGRSLHVISEREEHSS